MKTTDYISSRDARPALNKQDVLVRVEDFARPYRAGDGVMGLLDALPKILAADSFRTEGSSWAMANSVSDNDAVLIGTRTAFDLAATVLIALVKSASRV